MFVADCAFQNFTNEVVMLERTPWFWWRWWGQHGCCFTFRSVSII